MLVDLVGYFNYHHIMAEIATTDEATATAGGTDSEVEAPLERITPRLKTETQNVTQALFRRMLNGKTPDQIDADPVASKIFTAEYLGNLTKEQMGDGMDMPGPDGFTPGSLVKGTPLFMNVNGERVRVAKIVGTGTDTLRCKYLVDKGDGAPDALDSAYLTADIPREQIKDATLVAEREDILKGLTGDERAVAEAYFQSIDPEAVDPDVDNDILRKQVENVAEQNGMITAQVILEAADAMYGGSPPDEVMLLLSDFDAEGKTVLDKGDLEAAFKVLGVDRGWLGRQADDLLGQLSQEVSKRDAAAKSGGDTTIFQNRIDEINSHLAVITTADKLWKEKEAAGESPIDDYLDKAVNGDLDPQILSELRVGKLDSVAAILFDKATEHMSEAEKAEAKTNFDKFRSGSWKGIKFGGIFMLILAAIPAAAVVGGLQLTGQLGGGHR